MKMSMGCPSFPWFSMGFPWFSMGGLWFSIVFHGFPWVSMIFQGFSRVFMAKLIHVAPLGRGSCQAKKAKDAKSATAKAVKAKAVKARAGESHVVFETFWDISRHLQTMDFVNRRRRSVWEKWKMRIGIQIQLLKINIRVSKQFMFAAAHGSLTKNRGDGDFDEGLQTVYCQPPFTCKFTPNPASTVTPLIRSTKKPGHISTTHVPSGEPCHPRQSFFSVIVLRTVWSALNGVITCSLKIVDVAYKYQTRSNGITWHH